MKHQHKLLEEEVQCEKCNPYMYSAKEYSWFKENGEDPKKFHVEDRIWMDKYPEKR